MKGNFCTVQARFAVSLCRDNVRQQRANVRSFSRTWLGITHSSRVRTSAIKFAPRSECTQATLRQTVSVVMIAQDENRRCDSIGSGHDPSNSDTRRHERGGSQCEPMDQSRTCQSTTCALRMPRALPNRCLSLNHLRRMSGDRLSTRVLTCFREDHRKVDPRRAGPTDTGFHRTMFALRTKRDAMYQPSWVRNLNSHQRTIFQELRTVGRNLAYAPMRRNSKVVSGLMTWPFISSSG
jgi:hypothetical protein